MSVSAELLCSFELLKPLDSAALKNHIKKGRNKRNSILSSPVSSPLLLSFLFSRTCQHWSLVRQCRASCSFCFFLSLRVFLLMLFANHLAACDCVSPKLLSGLVLCTPRSQNPYHVTVQNSISISAMAKKWSNLPYSQPYSRH